MGVVLFKFLPSPEILVDPFSTYIKKSSISGLPDLWATAYLEAPFQETRRMLSSILVTAFPVQAVLGKI